MIDDYDPNSRRKNERRNTVLGARLLAGDASVDCTILNISDGGAKLRLVNMIDVKGPVRLGLGSFGEFPCDVLWQEHDMLGVRFQGDAEKMAEVVMGLALYG